MDKCNIFLSTEENYQETAKKIKQSLKIPVNIIWIEEFMKSKNKEEQLNNSIIYFLCNSPLIKELVNILCKTNCYIFNKEFFKKNYTKLEMQKKLIENKIRVPKIFENDKIDKKVYPIFCKQNVHDGMVFKIYKSNTINKFFEKFEKDEFYFEEAIESDEENKIYFIKENIYCKNNAEIKEYVKDICVKISLVLNLDIFSVDMMKKNDDYIVFDVNPAPGFYMLDEARSRFVFEIEKLI